MSKFENDDYALGSDIAVIGMAGRFPGAQNIEQFWWNVRNGVESIRLFSPEELDLAAIGRVSLNDPNFVPAGAVLEEIEYFDAGFFEFTPREAEVMDPQQRIFLECAWEAMENAGYYAGGTDGAIGVYAGATPSTYLLNLYSNPGVIDSVGFAQVAIGNNVDFLTTIASYKLNLRGPSIAVQTACSTSLVAVHVARQALLDGECDIAMAGGVSVRAPQRTGYLYQEGGIFSPDGHCRAFDSKAQGTVFGNGAAIVVLKRLEDALADGDHIRAIIKGSAVNNDGSLKVGFTAPSVQGQSAVIIEALANAGLSADDIGYVEAHGTGTMLGDPIEIQALTEAFRATTNRRAYCPIGSLKSNVGHLDAAAGVAGLIKTILAVEHGAIPPILHCEETNPKIDFAASPFFVPRKLTEWKNGAGPRRAGVSSLGIGGTNAHVVVEQAPPQGAPAPSRDWQLLVLSGKTESALDAATQNLASYLRQRPDACLADVAYTLQVGRKPFPYRRRLVTSDAADAAQTLESGNRERLQTALVEPNFKPIVFMFPGQASQYTGMAVDLYRSEKIFREQVDHCASLLRPYVDFDLLQLLMSPEGSEDAPSLDQTCVTQPTLFVIEYALARWLMSLGLKPQAMIGHSIGEYTAACVAGVLSLEDTLQLVAARGRLIQAIEGGVMLSAQIKELDARKYLNGNLSLAAVNAPNSCVISGAAAAVGELEKTFKKSGIHCRRLHTSHAFHSAMMEPALAPFLEVVQRVRLNPPEIPYLSNVTGDWIGAEATTPEYWTKHLRSTVRFSAEVSELLKDPNRILLEVGPGQSLSDLVRSHQPGTRGPVAIPLMRHARDGRSDIAHFLGALGKAWLAGAQIDWPKLYTEERRRRIQLPTYPFERQRYWIDAKPFEGARNDAKTRIEKQPDSADWFYAPSWKRALPLAPPDARPRSNWLIFLDEAGVGERLAARLEALGQACVRVLPAGQSAAASDFQIDLAAPSDYQRLWKALRQSNREPSHIVHLWNVDRGHETAGPEKNAVAHPEVDGYGLNEGLIDRGFYSLLFLAQAMARANVVTPVRLWLISNHLHNLSGRERIVPEKSMALGPCKVIPQEHTNIRCSSIDIEAPQAEGPVANALTERLLAELFDENPDPVIAHRGEFRWLQHYEPLRIETTSPSMLREGGVYLIAGGLGRFGMLLARRLAEAYQAKLILTSRRGLPPREQWEDLTATSAPDDPLAESIRNVLELESLGAETMILPLDFSAARQVKAVVDEAVRRFGALNGVIHAAGLQEHTAIESADRADCERMFASKVQGLFDLEEALRRREIDFCLLTSSLSPILGGLGFAAYAAANLHLDAFAQHLRQSRRAPWMSLNWEAWHRRKSTEDANEESMGGLGSEMARLVMTDEEVIDCFERALTVRETSQLIIATGDLEPRIDHWIRLKSLKATETPRKAQLTAHGRPKRLNDFVAPRDEIERTIVEVGRAVLGIDEIGVYDNFFEMGGSSLLAVQLISRLRETFQQQISLRALFDRPTVAGLAEIIREESPREENLIEISSLLAEIEGMDDEETQRRLVEAIESTGTV